MQVTHILGYFKSHWAFTGAAEYSLSVISQIILYALDFIIDTQIPLAVIIDQYR